MTRAIFVIGLLQMLLPAACSAPQKPTSIDMDLLDAGFRESPSAGDKAAEILKKEELSLDEVLRLADLLNPTLESLRRDVDLAPLEAWDASIFPNPELEVEVEDFPTEEGRSLGNAERGFGLSQAIPVGGRLGAASAVAEFRRKVAALRYLWERRVLLTEVKNAFLSVLAARRNLELTEETRDLAARFHDLTADRFKAEAIPEMEMLKAAVNLAKSETDVRSAEKDLEIAVKTLHALIGDIHLPVRRFSGELFPRFEAPALETLTEKVAAGHPRLRIASLEKEAARSELDLAHAEAIPDVELGVGYKWTPEDEHVLEFGLSVPLQLFHRNQANITAAGIRVRQAELTIRETRTGVMLSLIETYRNFAAAQEEVATYRDTILPKARLAVQQTNEGYEAGKFSYLDVLDSQQTLAEARIAYLFALRELNHLASELEKMAGSRLRGIR